MKNIQYLLILLIALTLIHCEEDRDPNFLITSSQVGKLMRTSSVSDLESIYTNDSIVRDTLQSNLLSTSNTIKIYEKGGQQLLTITANRDSIPKVGIIRILDPRFTTEEGIGLQSTLRK